MNRTIHLITFASHLHKQALRASHEVILTEMEKYFTLRLIDNHELTQMTPDDFCVVFIASGGVERTVIQYFEHLPRPIILLADGMQNSLAASLEIAAWLRERGMKCEVLHGDLQGMMKRLFMLYHNHHCARQLSGMRIGVVGTPSQWLIASGVDYLLAKRRWGVEYADIPLEEVIDTYHTIGEEEVGEACATLASRALACREANPEDLIKAMRFYTALKRKAMEYRLDALTLSCFRLIEPTGTTGCLALALLNDDGITAGCEGDLQSIFTMLVSKVLTSTPGFMANPSMVNEQNNEIVLGHCTIGLKQTDRFILRSHYETGKGIGIQGILPEGDVTLVKCGGECLDEYFLSSGRLIENTNYINLCRTQIRVRLNTPTDYFLKSSIGNHHILLPGNHTKVLEEFFQTNGCRRRE